MRHSRPASTLAALSIVALVSGCKVNARDIDHWQQTERGPTKLAALVASPRYDDALRARALVALATMERDEPEPIEAFEQAITRLRTARDPALPRLIDAMLPGLEQAMRGGDRPGRPGEPPSDQQAAAKDAAFLLYADASPATRERIGRALVSWFAQDFARRNMAGRKSAEDVVQTLGGSSLAQMVPALDARLDKDAMVRVCELVARHGDDAAKAQAGARIVAIEREMESQAFLDWVKGEVRRAMTVGGTAPPDNRVTASAVLTRESLVTQGAIAAMKSLAGRPEVAARLLEIARNAPPAGTPPALADVMNERRTQALVALEDNVTEAHVPALLALALDPQLLPTVRELAFDRLADSGSRSAIAPMWPLIAVTGLDGDAAAQRQARKLRWRAGELVLEIAGPGGVSELYARLPAAPTAAFEPAELEGYANRIAAMRTPPTDAMRADLRSPIWWRRVVAIHFLARTGAASDVPTLERMSSDALPTVGAGFTTLDPPQNTVGKVAAAALTAMRERLAAPPTAPSP